MQRWDPRRWLQYWPVLFFPLAGATIGYRLFCSRYVDNCEPPSGSVAVGALVGLIVAIIAVGVEIFRQGPKAPWVPESLMLSARADDTTADDAHRLGLRIRSGDALVVMVSARGIQLLSSAPSSSLLLDTTWEQLGPPELDDSRRKGFTPIDSAAPPVDYPRLSLDVGHRAAGGQLRLPIASRNSEQFCDTYELLDLIREINDYRIGERR